MKTKETIERVKQNKIKIENLIESFSKSINEGKCEQVFVDVFHKISFYTNELLTNEKLYIKETNPNLFNELIDKRREFTDKMESIQKKYEHKTPGYCTYFLDFLLDRYRNHIIKFEE